MAKSDIVIRRKKSQKDKEDIEDPDLFDEMENEEDESSDENEDKKYDKQLKTLSVVLFLFAVMLAIALLTYTSKDEANAQITFDELIDLITGDERLQYRAETTYNYLGIIGAFISKWLYKSTVGYIIVFLPYFLALISKDLFKDLEITNSTLKKSIVFILFTILFSGFTGSMANFEYFSNMSIEWSGTVGLYLAQLTSNLIGNIGAILFYFAAIIALIILGTNFKIDFLLNKGLDTVESGSSKAKSSFINLRDKLFEKADEVKKEQIAKKTSKKLEKKEAKKKANKEAKEKKLDKINQLQDNEEINSDKDIENEIKLSEGKDINDKAESKTDLLLQITRNAIKESKEVISKPSIKISKANDENYNKSENINISDSNSDSDIDDKINKPAVMELNIDNTIIDEINESPISGNQLNISENESKTDISAEISNLMEDVEINVDTNEGNDESDLLKQNELIIEDAHDVKLILDVDEIVEEDVLSSPLSTIIHDEKIKYIPPKFNLLEPDKGLNQVDDIELKNNARILQEKLETFKINIENLQVTPGPVVTQFAFTPAAGIKISRIESLSDDLAMALKARGIRIIAPIPGKGSVGIEIPNANPSLVSFSSVIRSKKFQKAELFLPFALGKTISGEVAIADLAKMPHLLIAGSTGSGKSVGVNSIISSLLYKKMPSELKFVIIDPKKVELQQYSKLKNHFIAMSPDVRSSIITDPIESVSVLKSAVLEMENRYDILARVGQRNIADYNIKVKQGKYANDKEMVHRPMPYIVVIVDEFADLILTAGKDVEEPIVRLAQMARAIGIHMVLATQRPSVDVITGIIKANFPARMAFLVASKIDSRTILDMSGAEQLLGNGDLLFLPSGRPKPERIQNAFISTDEVDEICNHIGNQKGYSEPYFLPSIHEKKSDGDMIEAADRDILFEDAARLIISTQQGSVSMLQRRLKIGYARAGRIVDELEDAGVVGPFDGSKARMVIMESTSELERIL